MAAARCSRPVRAGSCATSPWRNWCGSWRSTPSRTGSAPASATGPPSARTRRARSASSAPGARQPRSRRSRVPAQRPVRAPPDPHAAVGGLHRRPRAGFLQIDRTTLPFLSLHVAVSAQCAAKPVWETLLLTWAEPPTPLPVGTQGTSPDHGRGSHRTCCSSPTDPSAKRCHRGCYPSPLASAPSRRPTASP